MFFISGQEGRKEEDAEVDIIRTYVSKICQLCAQISFMHVQNNLWTMFMGSFVEVLVLYLCFFFNLLAHLLAS